MGESPRAPLGRPLPGLEAINVKYLLRLSHPFAQSITLTTATTTTTVRKVSQMKNNWGRDRVRRFGLKDQLRNQYFNK